MGRPPIWTRRQLIDGIRWRTRTGTPWRDVPERYGPWGRVYDLFRRWQRNGTWQWIFTKPQVRADAKGLIAWDINVDSTVYRAHQHAAGARKRGTFRRNLPAASSPSRMTTASDPNRFLTVRLGFLWRFSGVGPGCLLGLLSAVVLGASGAVDRLGVGPSLGARRQRRPHPLQGAATPSLPLARHHGPGHGLR
ncbi:transposase [Streptomyces sanglieri]|uniref:transposase n=1 Tax=Streptomyces sanglieri TaxID=193460 RepID=UPI003523C2A8